MRFFWQKKDKDELEKPSENVAEEVQEYYQAERRERVGLAWLLGSVTLIVTFGVVLGLFMGGRALYHKLAKRSTAPVAVTPITPETPSTTKTPNPTSPTPPPASPPTPPTTPPPSSPPVSTPPVTPSTLPASNSALPRTGPDGDD